MKKLTRSKALKEILPTAIETQKLLQQVLISTPKLKDKIEAFNKLNDKFITYRESIEESNGEYVSQEIQELFEEVCEKDIDLITSLVKRGSLHLVREKREKVRDR
jgi:hypothetical protein